MSTEFPNFEVLWEPRVHPNPTLYTSMSPVMHWFKARSERESGRSYVTRDKNWLQSWRGELITALDLDEEGQGWVRDTNE